jgi:hypothetical protein
MKFVLFMISIRNTAILMEAGEEKVQGEHQGDEIH